jgi:hypothetical protein
MKTVEKMKKAGSVEQALNELGKDLEERLSECGHNYGDLAGKLTGTIIYITEKLMTGEFDEKKCEEWKEAAKLSYRDKVSEIMKRFGEYIDELTGEIVAEQQNLRSLKKGVQQSDYIY